MSEQIFHNPHRMDQADIEADWLADQAAAEGKWAEFMSDEPKDIAQVEAINAIGNQINADRKEQSPIPSLAKIEDDIRERSPMSRTIAERYAVAEREALISMAVTALASELHEDWRSTRKQEDGTYEPRVKSTKDATWIEKHGSDQVDIANTSFEDLPEDWQRENTEAAKVVVELLDQYGYVDLEIESARNKIGEVIHAKWLKRNEWAKGGELDVPFDQLPPEEQEKDIAQVRIAQKLFSRELIST